MDFARDLVLILHFIGMSALFGGFFVQLRTPTKVVNSAMLHGALTQLVTGILLVGLIYADDGEPDNAKITVKTVIILVISALAWINRKRDSVSAGVWWAIGLLTVANIAVAVLW